MDRYPFRTAGRFAVASFWISGVPSGADLNDLIGFFDGRRAQGCYLSPITPDGGCQMNVLLPPGLTPKLARVTLVYHGRLVGEKFVDILPAPPPVPKLLSVTDGVDLLSDARIHCGRMKVDLEGIQTPLDVTFEIDGADCEPEFYECTDRMTDRYYYTIAVPAGLSTGKYKLDIRASGFELPATELEVVSGA